MGHTLLPALLTLQSNQCSSALSIVVKSRQRNQDPKQVAVTLDMPPRRMFQKQS